MSPSRKNELKFVFLAIIAFGCFSLSQGLLGVSFLILTYVSFRSLQNTKNTVSHSPQVLYAGFWVRLGSLTIDAGFTSLLFLLAHFAFQMNAYQPLVNSGFSLIELIIILYMIKTWGKSPGKMVLGIKIVKTDFSPLGWKEVFLRTWNQIFSDVRYFTEYLLIFLGVLSAGLVFTGTSDTSAISSRLVKIIHDKSVTFDVLWLCSEPFVLLTNPQKRALHDYIAGTVVVFEKNKISKFSRTLVLLSIFTISLNIYFFQKDQFRINQMEAQHGSAISQRFLAIDYFYGRGVQKSYPDAFNWFQKAAEGGDSRAQEYLGIMYENGYYVKADQEEAIKWYKLSLKNGDYKSKKALKRLGVEDE